MTLNSLVACHFAFFFLWDKIYVYSVLIKVKQKLYK